MTQPRIISIRRGPGGPADWLVTIEGHNDELPIRDRRLRTYKKFCNVIRHRLGINFDPMPQDEWSAIIETAIEKGGGA